MVSDVLKWRHGPFCAVRSEAFLLHQPRAAMRRRTTVTGGNWQVNSPSLSLTVHWPVLNHIKPIPTPFKTAPAARARWRDECVLEYHHSGKVDHSTCSLVYEHISKVSLGGRKPTRSQPINADSEIAVGEKMRRHDVQAPGPAIFQPQRFTRTVLRRRPESVICARPPVSGARNKDIAASVKNVFPESFWRWNELHKSNPTVPTENHMGG